MKLDEILFTQFINVFVFIGIVRRWVKVKLQTGVRKENSIPTKLLTNLLQYKMFHELYSETRSQSMCPYFPN